MGDDLHSGSTSAGRCGDLAAVRAPLAAPISREGLPGALRVADAVTATVRGTALTSLKIAVTATLATAVLAGCSSQGTAALPGKTSQPSSLSTNPAPAPSSARAAVIAAYDAYFPVSVAAEAAGPSRAKAMLAPYAAPAYLNRVLSQMAAYRARHEVTQGRVVPHITRVVVSGPLARVYDCQDASHAALANSRTGRVIPHTRGSARTYLIAGLARASDGRWRLTSLAHVAVSCNPVPSPS